MTRGAGIVWRKSQPRYYCGYSRPPLAVVTLHLLHLPPHDANEELHDDDHLQRPRKVGRLRLSCATRVIFDEVVENDGNDLI